MTEKYFHVSLKMTSKPLLVKPLIRPRHSSKGEPLVVPRHSSKGEPLVVNVW